MPQTEIKTGIIALTSDPVQLAKLRNKLQEYGARATVASPPEKDPDTIYKFRLLSELMDKAIIDVEAIEREFAKYAWFDRKLFWNAVGVITSYNQNAPALIVQGTGTGLR